MAIKFGHSAISIACKHQLDSQRLAPQPALDQQLMQRTSPAYATASDQQLLHLASQQSMQPASQELLHSTLQRVSMSLPPHHHLQLLQQHHAASYSQTRVKAELTSALPQGDEHLSATARSLTCVGAELISALPQDDKHLSAAAHTKPTCVDTKSISVQ